MTVLTAGARRHRLLPPLTGRSWQALNIDRLRFTASKASAFALSRSQTLDLHYDWLIGTQDTIPGTYTKYSFNYPADSGVARGKPCSVSSGCCAPRSALNRRVFPVRSLDIYVAYAAGKAIRLTSFEPN